MFNIIQLQLTGFAGTPDNPYFSAFMGGVIVVIFIAALIAHRKEKREKIQSNKKSC